MYPRSSTFFSQSVGGVTELPQSVVNYDALQKEIGPKPSLYKGRKVNEYKQLLQNAENKRSSSQLTRTSSKMTSFTDVVRKKSSSTIGVHEIRAKSSTGEQPNESDWLQMKPHSGALHHSGLKWERVKDIVHNNLTSTKIEERIDAIRQLRELKCCDTMVVHALKQCLKEETDELAKYETVKCLVVLGCLDKDVMKHVARYLKSENRNISTDLLNALTESKSLSTITQKEERLIEALRNFCKKSNEDSEANEISRDVASDIKDVTSVHAAMCLVKLGIYDSGAEQVLHDFVIADNDKHLKAQVLPLLISYTKSIDWKIIKAVLDQLELSNIWNYRKKAAKLLMIIGRDVIIDVCNADLVFAILERKLWDEPMMEVRKQVAKTVIALGIYPNVCERVERQLRDASDEVRTHAAVSVATLGMKTDRIVQMLLDMVDLDNSRRVKKAVLQTLLYFKCADWRVLRAKDRILASND